MKWLALALPLLLAGCNQNQESGEPVSTVDLEHFRDGTEAPEPAPEPSEAVASACADETFEGVGFTHCVARPGAQSIGMALLGDGGAPYRSFAAYRAAHPDEQVAFAMNGGMFDDTGNPIGYYVENGDRRTTLNRNDGTGNFHLKPNGVFYGSGNSWHVMDSESFYNTVSDRPRFGTQSGPMLVIDGQIHPEITENGPSRYIRNAVGVDAAGNAHFVISDADVSFGVMARYFRDQLHTPNALYLDGVVSSLWDPATGRMDVRAPLGPLIVVTNAAP